MEWHLNNICENSYASHIIIAGMCPMWKMETAFPSLIETPLLSALSAVLHCMLFCLIWWYSAHYKWIRKKNIDAMECWNWSNKTKAHQKKKQQHQKQQQWQHQPTRKQQRQIYIHVDIVRSKRHLYFALIYLGSARVGLLFMCWLFSQRVLLISEVLRWHSSVFCVWFGHTDRASERQRSREIKRESEQTTRDRHSSFAYTYIFYSFSHSGFGILFWICKNECWIIDKVVYSTLCMCAVCLVISLD